MLFTIISVRWLTPVPSPSGKRRARNILSIRSFLQYLISRHQLAGIWVHRKRSNDYLLSASKEAAGGLICQITMGTRKCRSPCPCELTGAIARHGTKKTILHLVIKILKSVCFKARGRIRCRSGKTLGGGRWRQEQRDNTRYDRGKTWQKDKDITISTTFVRNT